MRPSAYSTSPEVLGTIPRPWASCVGICRNPVKPVSMTASKTLTGGDAALALEMEIVTTGLPLASNDPTTFGIRRTARAVGTWIPDAHQVVGPVLGRFNGLPVHRLRRVTEEELCGCDVGASVRCARLPRRWRPRDRTGPPPGCVVREDLDARAAQPKSASSGQRLGQAPR